MSLSHQKKQAEKIECPTCGRISMSHQKGNSAMIDGFKVKNIYKWVCSYCKEEMYDLETMKKIHELRIQEKLKTFKL